MGYQLEVSFHGKSGPNKSSNGVPVLIRGAEAAGWLFPADPANVLGNELATAAEAACAGADFKSASKQFLAVHGQSGPLLVAGAGEGLSAGLSAEEWGGALYRQMRAKPFRQLRLDGRGIETETLADIAAGALLASYEFNRYFTSKKKPAEPAKLMILCDSPAKMKPVWADRQALANGVSLARDLLYEPANQLYPAEFAKRCKKLAGLGLKVEVLAESKLRQLGMGALLGVGQGSARDSAVVIMHWQGGPKKQQPLVLVGKGVCFDTGGISLKPAKGMEDMKWDMGGAAAVTGTMAALAGRKAKRNIIGIIGLVENMPDGNAQRPGDVVTSLSGQTIEVINTDAEGRLVLADLLTYVQDKFKPAAMVDLATLTGAIIVSLGKEYAGLFANNDDLAEQIEQAGRSTGEKNWRMPLGKAYDNQLKSHIADMKNIGGPWGGSITAACFLQRFVKKTPWAHLDIAGKVWADKAGPLYPAGGTGYGVRLLNRLADDWQDLDG
jgi:leucyl aminopeptidase